MSTRPRSVYVVLYQYADRLGAVEKVFYSKGAAYDYALEYYLKPGRPHNEMLVVRKYDVEMAKGTP